MRGTDKKQDKIQEVGSKLIVEEKKKETIVELNSEHKVKSIFEIQKEKKKTTSNTRTAQVLTYRDKIVEMLVDSMVEKYHLGSLAGFGELLFKQLIINMNNKGEEHFDKVLQKSYQFDEYIEENVWSKEDFWKQLEGTDFYDLKTKYPTYVKLPVSNQNGGKKIVTNTTPEIKSIIEQIAEDRDLKTNKIGSMLMKSVLLKDLYLIHEVFGLSLDKVKPIDVKKIVKNTSELNKELEKIKTKG